MTGLEEEGRVTYVTAAAETRRAPAVTGIIGLLGGVGGLIG